MVSSSESPNRGLVHWPRLLLVVSLLNFWSQPTLAHVKVQSANAIEDTEAILHIHNRPRNATAFLWYRGENIESTQKIAYLSVNSGSYVRYTPSEKVMIEDDGSLLLKNITMKDAGVYTLVVELHGCQKMAVCGQLNVYPSLTVPTLRASKTTFRENKDAVVMTCYTNHNGIEWLFNGRSLMPTETMKLSADHRNLTIDPALRKNEGSYACKISSGWMSARSASLMLYMEME